MLYNKNREESLSKELFKSPSAEYRGTPFWAWNSRLDRDELAFQIEQFAKMGFGGFHMHVRQGLEDEYMGEEFLDAIRFCTEKAKSMGLLAWLYDEDRWPSGVAGGKVTSIKKYRLKYLSLSSSDREECANTPEQAAETGMPYFLAAFSVTLDREGRMTEYKRVERDAVCENKRYFFIEQKQGGEPRFNYQTYVDSLNKEAIDKFISVTHEGFYRAVGDEFSKTIPAIFTDEPQVVWHNFLKSGFDTGDAQLGFTTDFASTYEECFGDSLIDKLPELFYATDIPTAKQTRYRYFSHLSERFCSAYMDNIGEWCEKHNLMLTGHVLGEDSLYEAALNNGDIMRTYRKMGLPGIDILCDDVVYVTPIQCRSIVRQTGREAMLTELYGVTGWDFDFRGHKFQGDWQACLGATVRVPHLAWQTMKGEGKRDYPASLSYQSAWYKEYKLIEDHYARIATALTRGKPEARIAVLYPVDSYNINVASVDETQDIRRAMDEKYKDCAEWLLSGMFDYDYLSESLLPELCTSPSNPLKVGMMEYDAVIVANTETLRPYTVKALCAFAKAGGRLIVAGDAPTLMEGIPSEEVSALVSLAQRIPHSRYHLLNSIADLRSVDVRDENGARTSGLMCTTRADGDSRWIFLAHMYKPALPHFVNEEKLSITVKGLWHPYVYNTLSGEVEQVSFVAKNGETTVYKSIYDLDTLLIKLEKAGEGRLDIPADNEGFVEQYHAPVCDYQLSEPNVLLLDMARYSVNGEPLSEQKEEIMRIDGNVRARLGLTSRRTKVVQPWAIKGEPENHTLSLEFSFDSDIELDGAYLAMENPERAKLSFNGEEFGDSVCGWYVDMHIKTVALPRIRKGKNVLSARMPFGKRTDLEAFYIIGDFGTEYVGRDVFITEAPERLAFGDIVHQGLAFYGGNLTYSAQIELDAPSDIELTVSQYRGALVGVEIDGVDAGRIAFPPFTLRKNDLKAGVHNVKYTLYGTRYNTFSALHNINADKKRVYIGPDYWRSENEAWSYEYITRPMGILKTPVLKVRRK